MPRGSLLTKVNEVINAAKADGRYDAIYQKWFGKLEKRPAAPRRSVEPVSLSKGKQVVDVDLERPWVTVSWALPDATTPQGEHPFSLLARVRTLPGCADAVPVHRLDLGTSGVCLFARNPEHVSTLSSALAAGGYTLLL